MLAHISTYGPAAGVCLYFNHQQWPFPTFTCCTLLLRAQTPGICIINYVYFCMRYILLALPWNNIFSSVFSHLYFFFSTTASSFVFWIIESKIMEKRWWRLCPLSLIMYWSHESAGRKYRKEESNPQLMLVKQFRLTLIRLPVTHTHTWNIAGKRPHICRNSLTWMHI